MSVNTVLLTLHFLKEPQEVRLGRELHIPGLSGHNPAHHYCYYVSLIDSLQMMLNVPEVQKQVQLSNSCAVNKFENSIDGICT